MLTPSRIWDGPLRAFTPSPSLQLDAAFVPSTVVQITNAGTGEVPLVLTFASKSSATSVQRVAALQPVLTNVRIDFGAQASLMWMASLQQQGVPSPNTAAQPYTAPDDRFQLSLGALTLTHDANGWTVPAYDSRQYELNVGFGLQIAGWIYWGSSVRCTPQQPVKVDAAGYVLARSDGAESIGDPVAPAASWTLPLGGVYALAFDASGNATLTTLSSA